MRPSEKPRAPRNKTINLSTTESSFYERRLLRLSSETTLDGIRNRTLNQDTFDALAYLPSSFVDLLVLDPPYNLTKSFNQTRFARRHPHEYEAWFASWFLGMLHVLKPNASIYVCADWRCSGAVQRILEEHLVVRNRITWEREKGRGAASNWKNCLEDIWFCTVSDSYTFNLDTVKLRRRVIAPYTVDGEPKDWTKSPEGNYRLTHPSNLWTDVTVPFWSMPENTDHPTQKPEKLLAKLILASSSPNQIVLDPFLGSGTTSVVAKKLGRQWVGIEIDPDYCCLAEKRLALADHDPSIQGYSEGVFWERNSVQGSPMRPRISTSRTSAASEL
jgi:site-specific DNA-methyltransferase (adenine-specific)